MAIIGATKIIINPHTNFATIVVINIDFPAIPNYFYFSVPKITKKFVYNQGGGTYLIDTVFQR